MKKLIVILGLIISFAGYSQVSEITNGETGSSVRTKLNSIITSVNADNDGDATNEIQSISLTGNTISISDHISTIDLSAYLDNTDDQTLSIDSTNRVFTILLENGGSVKFEDTNTIYDLSDYATRSELHDTANVVRSEFPTMLIELDSANFRITESQISDLQDYLLDADLSGIRDTLGVHRDSVINYNLRIIAVEGKDTTGIYHINRSILDAITASDTAYWGSGGNFIETDPIVGVINGIVKADGMGNISAAVAGIDYLVTEVDGSTTNEIQDISTTGAAGNISISDGSTLNLNVDDADADATNEIQSISLTGNTLSISDHISTVDLSAYLDNTDNQNISGSGLSGTTLTIGIENGTNETVDLSSLQDGTGTDDQTASEVPITDAGTYFTATDVEGALQEIEGRGYLTSYTETDPDFNAHTASDIVDGTGFLKNNGSGTWSYDNSTYLTGNETITLSGDITGSGTTAITTSLATGSVSDNEIDYATVTLNDFINDAGFITSQTDDQTAAEVSYSNTTSGLTATNVQTAIDELDGKVDGLSSGGGAPADATYITQTENATLTAGQALSALSSGIVTVTTGTGVLSSIANNSTNWDTAYIWGDWEANVPSATMTLTNKSGSNSQWTNDEGYITGYTISANEVNDTHIDFGTGVNQVSTDDLTEGLTNLYNQTHTGDVTGATVLTITTGAVQDAEIDYTAVTLNDFTFDVGSVSKTEFGYLNGVTSAIQTQLNAKLESETDGSITNEGSLIVKAGTSTTSVISSNTSGSTDVTLTAGTNITLSESGNNITIAASGSSVPTFVYGETPTGTVNGTNDAFTTSNTPTSGTVRVYLNGLRQTPTTDYSVSTNTITFTTAPLTGDVIIVDYNY